MNFINYRELADNKRQALSGKEFQVMEMLMQNRGIIVTAEQRITHIRGWDTNVDANPQRKVMLSPDSM